MRPERRCKSGMDGGLTAASLVSSPLLYLRTAVFLSNQPGPPQGPTFIPLRMLTVKSLKGWELAQTYTMSSHPCRPPETLRNLERKSCKPNAEYRIIPSELLGT